MQSPLISVIIVVYNGVTKIKTALNSIIGQAYTGAEIVVIDGGSTDGTIDVLKSFSDKISFWSTEPDKGIYDAMNKGVRQAKGNWLYFLGSDDELYDESVLATAAHFLSTLNPDLLYGNVWMNNALYDGRFDFDKLLVKNISHQAIFYKKSVFEKVGFYNLAYRYHADWDFNIRCFMRKDLVCQYENFVVAKFGAGGVSAGHDIPFLREVLIPMSLEKVLQQPSYSYHISHYDRLWRMVRNAKIRSKEELESIKFEKKMPRVIQRIVAFQSRLPVGVLHNGFLSKTFMAFHFLLSKLK